MKQFKQTTIGKRVYTLYVNEVTDFFCDWYDVSNLEVTTIEGDFCFSAGIFCGDDEDIKTITDYDGVFSLTSNTILALKELGFNTSEVE